MGVLPAISEKLDSSFSQKQIQGEGELSQNALFCSSKTILLCKRAAKQPLFIKNR
jgi:hypothetical protein